ncbi:hypothetical protein WEN_01540 [Mycoplasma wenyonii str. Massachusetts]|uniref:Uncharacterized protein n=1 Tax=Mycoplasma wenyonii (strain Massachusetts) TaxID=1197325 RepID=I6Z695_MYCWM|nr:hypothetical protein [Mycoplasma wenyonii]AFN65103.1 hypothetical protein WEN_01540 [Mycoplasma wenyonii str. Massachusetts]
MSFLTLLAKVVSVVVVTGTAIATPLALNARKSSSTTTQTPLTSTPTTTPVVNYEDLSVQGMASRGECWEIPITPQDFLKFLVCANQDKYYLYDSSNSDNNKAFTKIKQISGPTNKQITITLDGEEETKTLTLLSEQLKNSPENLDFYNNCNTGTADQGMILSCSTNSPKSWNGFIELTNFQLNK